MPGQVCVHWSVARMHVCACMYVRARVCACARMTASAHFVHLRGLHWRVDHRYVYAGIVFSHTSSCVLTHTPPPPSPPAHAHARACTHLTPTPTWVEQGLECALAAVQGHRIQLLLCGLPAEHNTRAHTHPRGSHTCPRGSLTCPRGSHNALDAHAHRRTSVHTHARPHACIKDTAAFQPLPLLS